MMNQMSEASETAKEIVKAAACRLNLDGSLPAKIFAKTDVSYKANDLLLEYLYVMEVRLAQGHWADFVRFLTPALTGLMKRRLESYLPENVYTVFERGQSSNKYNVESIKKDSRLARTLLPCHYENKNAFITNDAYGRLIREYCEDTRVRDLVLKLRNAERHCRNSLAHTLRASSKVSLERLCGMTLEDVMDALFELYGTTERGLYDRINQRIVDTM